MASTRGNLAVVGKSPEVTPARTELAQLEAKHGELKARLAKLEAEARQLEEGAGQAVLNGVTIDRVAEGIDAAATKVRVARGALRSLEAAMEPIRQRIFQEEREAARVRVAELDAELDTVLQDFIKGLEGLVRNVGIMRRHREEQAELHARYRVPNRHGNTSYRTRELEVLLGQSYKDLALATGETWEMPEDVGRIIKSGF